MTEILVAALGLALVVILPGALLLVIARPDVSTIQCIAAVPLISLACVFLLAEWVSAIGIPFGPGSFLVFVALLAALAAARSRHGIWLPTRDRARESDRSLACALLVLAIGIGTFTWIHGMDTRATIPPNRDASAHGFFVARINETQSVEPSDVLVADGAGRDRAAEYYPLALHASLSIASRITDSTIALLLNAALVMFAAVVFPIGVFALTRFLFRDMPLAAGFAAVIGSLMSMFPYRPIVLGTIPLVVGMSLLPITVVLVAQTVQVWSRASAIVSILALFGLFTVHNSQLPLALGLVVLLVLADAWEARSSSTLGRELGRLAWITTGAIVLLAPTLDAVIREATARADLRTTVPMSATSFLRELLTLQFNAPQRQLGLALLALAGIVVVAVRRIRWEWVLGAVVVIGLATMAAASDDAATRLLTFPWYREPSRLAYNLAWFVPVFGGVALATVCAFVAARLRGRYVLVATVGASFLSLFALAGAGAVTLNSDMVRGAYTAYGPIGPDQVAAFRYLGRHADPRSTTLSDGNVDGAIWMAAFADARPLFGFQPEPDRIDARERDRQYLRRHIDALGRDCRVDDLVRDFHVEHVYFGAVTYETAPHLMSLAELRSVPGLREVFRRGGAHVFAVRPSERCP